MAWAQLIFSSRADLADGLSDALTETGAAAVTFEDQADEPIFEPAIGETPLWASTRVVALFDADSDFQQIERQLQQLLGQLPAYRLEAVEDKDWERAWMDNFEPMAFGQKLWIVPSWHQPPAPDAVNILLDPGLAFGTGTHPTTALCLSWLDSAQIAGQTVIDYGCGSGILAIAAALLGAQRVIGVDTDPQALQATRDNAARNGVEVETCLPADCPAIHADLVVANILAGPLCELQPTLQALLKPQGHLILSGILTTQADTVSQHYQQAFDMQRPAIRDEWVRLEGIHHAA